MRPLLLVFVLLLAPVASRAAVHRPLDLPIRVPGAATQVPAPAYAGDVVEIQLAPSAALTAWGFDHASTVRARLGVPGLDQASNELGGVRFTPLFRGERPPAVGSQRPDLTAFFVAHLPAGLDLERALDRLGSLPEVLHAEPIAILPVSAIPNDSLWSSSYWYYQLSRRDIHAPEAWDVTTGDTSVVVGIVDTGVLPYHPDIGGSVAGFSGQIYTNWAEANGVPGVDDDGNGYVDDIHGWDFVNLSSGSDVEPGEDWADEDNDPNDFAGHGTAVAGVVGALTNNAIGVAGMNWNVRLMPLRIGWSYRGAPLGSGEVRMDFVAAAVNYAARMGVDVINCSFATLNELGIDAALDAATAAGVTIVSAAGNNNDPNYIATRRDVISVASVSSDDILSGFSNRGPQVDLAAPGQNIASTFLAPRPVTSDSLALRQPSYRSTLNGTSFSAPLVTGTVALLQARRHQLGLPRLDPMSVQLRLFDTADDIRAQNPGLDGQYGSGRLNAARALTETWRSQAVRLGGKVVGAPAVFRVANGSTRVVIATDDRSLVMLDGASLDTLWHVTLPFVPLASPSLAPIPGGGMGIFVGLASGRVAGYLDDGTVLPGWPKQGTSFPMRGGTTTWDLDGDGVPEILAAADDGRVWAWHENGDVVPGFPVVVASARVLPLAVTHVEPVRIAAAAEDKTVTLLDGRGNVVLGPLTYSAQPSPPVFATIRGVPAVVFVENVTLHALDFAGTERPGFPVTLAAPLPSWVEVSIGDLDLNGVDDLALPGIAPAAIEARDSTGRALNGWPATLAASPIGSVVLGHLTGVAAPDLMAPLTSGLVGLTAGAASIWGFPKPGAGGTFPTLIDLDGDGTTEVLAGSSQDRLLFSYDAGTGSAAATPQPWPTYRGDFQRTGCAIERIDVPRIDLVAPGMVSDLAATTPTPSSVRLHWTASGDDGAVGRARATDLRYSTSPIDAGNFAAATHVPSRPTAAPGTPDSSIDVVLNEGFTYYFALRIVDDGANAGPLSNVVSVTLQIVSPAAVTDLKVSATTDTTVTLTWTATGASGNFGRPQSYVMRASTALLDDGNFNTAPYTRTITPTVDAGGRETYVFKFLMPATRYWFALKAMNPQAYLSSISNVVQTQTRVGGPLNSKNGIALAPRSNPSRVPVSLYWQSAPNATSLRQTIRIYDLTGRLVRTLEVGPGIGGVVAWDGRDDDGNRLRSALYVARLNSGSDRVERKLVVIP